MNIDDSDQGSSGELNLFDQQKIRHFHKQVEWLHSVQSFPVDVQNKQCSTGTSKEWLEIADNPVHIAVVSRMNHWLCCNRHGN